MPHLKRLVEPTLVSRVPVDPAVRDELECMTNGTLANLIRDLSSLSKHAEDMFRELSKETLEVCQRASGLQRRIEDVHDKVTRLNPNMDVLDLQSINLLKPFMSSNTKEQQVLSRSTVPRAIIEIYERCDPPPALNKLDQFREDGKSSMRFYTDPLYFEELWAIEMGKQFEENRKKANQKKSEAKKGRQQPARVKVKQAEAKSKEKFNKLKDGVELADYQDPAALRAKIDREQEEARRLRAQHEYDQAAAAERERQLQYQQQQVQEAKRQSQRKQILQQQQYEKQQQYYEMQQKQLQDNNYHPNQTHNNNMYVEDGTAMEDAYNTHIPYNNGQAGLPAAIHPHHHHPHPEDIPPPPPQPIDQREGKVPNGSVGHKRDTISSPNRPMAPPPAPPTNTSSRNSLPPPPSPPPPMEMPPRQTSMSPQGSRRGMLPDSRQSSIGLPPPPSPPPMMGGMTMMPPPPPSPPMPMQHSPPPPPPPPPTPPPAPAMMLQLNGGDTTSMSSESTAPGPSASAPESDRSALLQQIIQKGNIERLKKVEARTNQKQLPASHGHLDVQAMMEKVIDMRRKVIESSDSEADNSDIGDWDDSD
ncbi:hypothetical protein EGW08_013129 [Elysia chlorotica]|uniref:Wiskott-Aldrich syndrome protein family member n=1 Tax=Elysia chlorotica TaxID=188477 RepID=A0A3S1BZT2_ELYCH|nr:hypothetical protein EGW08_013129 [Elysia chlorotica]